MKKRLFPFFKRKDGNRGAALIAVIVTIAFIGTIAAIITTVTITNIRMKAIERGSRKNFYTSDSVIDALTSGISAKALDKLDDAYNDVMSNYIAYSSTDMQSIFSGEYIDALVGEFEFTSSDPAVPTGYQEKTDASGNVLTKSAKYETGKVEACLPAGVSTISGWFATKEDDAYYVADYDAGTFTLKNITVKEEDSQGYETTITTDIVLSTPSLSLVGTTSSEAFMNYSLIADTDIYFDTANVTVNGNVYAGPGGIIAAYISGSGTPSLIGNTIITRGDITTQSGYNGASLIVGGGSSSIWAENISINGDRADFSFDGTCYIADDLEVNGDDSTVTLNGSYYGYNFQENYDSVNAATDAAYSSAIVINALDSNVNLSGLNYLMLAGRTFISRNVSGNTSGDTGYTYEDTTDSAYSGGDDVIMGESLSVQSNQLAYFVSDKYLEEKSDGNYGFSDDGLVSYEDATGVANVDSYLADPQVVPYYYNAKDSDGNATVGHSFYLNFKDETSANEFFSEYMSGGKSGRIQSEANSYLTDSAIVLGSGLAYALRGDLLYRDSSGADVGVKSVTIGSTWDESGALWNTSVSLAKQYKALELTLENTSASATADNVRIGNSKTDDSLFEYIVDTSALSTVTGGASVSPTAYTEGSAIVVNNTGAVYNIPTTFTKGLVLASGDVYIDHDFTGLIICGGEIKFGSNVTINSDASLIMDLFEEDLAGSNYFAQYFKAFAVGSSTSGSSADIDISNYVGYANWTKNSE